MVLKLNGTTIVDDARQIQNLSSEHDSSTWTTGTNANPTLVSPSKLVAAIAELGGGVGFVESSGEPAEPTAGMLWHNTLDSDFYMYIDSSELPDSSIGSWLAIETISNASPSTFENGFFAGGGGAAYINNIDRIRISSPGNASDWGDLTANKNWGSQASNGNKAVYMGGWTGSAITAIDQYSLVTSGNAADVGDITQARGGTTGHSNGHRAVLMGGATASNTPTTTIDYTTFFGCGVAVDFGDMSPTIYSSGAVCNGVRGLHGGGYSGSNRNYINYITIGVIGNSTDFGDLTTPRKRVGGIGGGNPRGLFHGGGEDTSPVNIIEYVTVATTGNATDFGDLTVNRGKCGGTSSPIRGVFGGGMTGSSTYSNVLDYVTVATTGNATDFGDLNNSVQYAEGVSGFYGVI